MSQFIYVNDDAVDVVDEELGRVTWNIAKEFFRTVVVVFVPVANIISVHHKLKNTWNRQQILSFYFYQIHLLITICDDNLRWLFHNLK